MNPLSWLLTQILGSQTHVSEKGDDGVIRQYIRQDEPNLVGRIKDLFNPQASAINIPPAQSEFPNPSPQAYSQGLPSPTPSYSPHPSAAPYMEDIQNYSQQYGIPEKTFHDVLSRESMGFNPDVISGNVNSPVGAQGIAQFMPDTAEWWQNSHGKFDPLEPEQAIPASAHYLQYLYDQFGSWPETLAAYNWGEGNVRNQGIDQLPQETVDYLDTILGEWR